MLCGSGTVTTARLMGEVRVRGTVAHVHQDSRGDAQDDCVTELLYPNQHWDPSYSGETMFF